MAVQMLPETAKHKPIMEYVPVMMSFPLNGQF